GVGGSAGPKGKPKGPGGGNSFTHDVTPNGGSTFTHDVTPGGGSTFSHEVTGPGAVFTENIGIGVEKPIPSINLEGFNGTHLPGGTSIESMGFSERPLSGIGGSQVTGQTSTNVGTGAMEIQLN